MKKITLLLLISNFLLVSCIKNTYTSGAANILNPVEIQNLSKDQLLNKLGSPTIVNNKLDETWVYISDHYEKIAFMPRKIISQQVLVVKFQGDQVIYAKYYSNEDIKRIKFSKLATPSFGDDTTLLKEIFSNLGRFNVRKGTQSGH